MSRLKRCPAQLTLRSSANTPFSAPDSGRQISPGLSSNNPFRNRAVSPANSLPSPVTNTFPNIPITAPERPTSRNPFLDQSEKKSSATVQVRPISPDQGGPGMAGQTSQSKPVLTGHAVDLFVRFYATTSIWKSVTNHSRYRTTSLSMMDHQQVAHRHKASLHHTVLAHHEQKPCPKDLKTFLPGQEPNL